MTRFLTARRGALLCFSVFTLAATDSLACACGCGVFDVGTGSLLPTQQGGIAFIEYDFLNQNRNWHATSRAPSDNNDDKDVKTSFVTVGAKYMFNRAWGIEGQVPYMARHFTATDDATGDIVQRDHSAFGDVRIKGIYSGFSDDMSTGITFGLKLPTGDYRHTGFDRDTAIGSGSTDLLLGAYHMRRIAGNWSGFARGEWAQPMLIRSDYRPGAEANASLGAYYEGWTLSDVKIAPVGQIINTYRLQDRGLAAHRTDSGYERVLLSPGIEVNMGRTKLCAQLK